MEYSESYQSTRDIDWFFKIGGRNIHVASNGGKIPDFVNDILRLRNEQAKVSMLESLVPLKNIIVNQNVVDGRIQETLKNVSVYQYDGISSDTLKEAYLKSFKEMASKGFYSYDRVLGEDSKYILVCFPSEEVDLSNHHIVLLDATDEIEFSDNEQECLIVKTKFRGDAYRMED